MKNRPFPKVNNGIPMMKKNLLTITLIFITQLVFSQVDDCKFFNGIGSNESKKPSLSINFSNGLGLSICGYEEEIISETEVIISEFDVFNCKTGESLIAFGALQTCTVITKTDTLMIEEMIDLPVEKDWKNKKVKVTRRKFYPQSDTLIMSPPVGIYKETFIDQEQVDQFFKDLNKQ